MHTTLALLAPASHVPLENAIHVARPSLLLQIFISNPVCLALTLEYWTAPDNVDDQICVYVLSQYSYDNNKNASAEMQFTFQRSCKP